MFEELAVHPLSVNGNVRLENFWTQSPVSSEINCDAELDKKLHQLPISTKRWHLYAVRGVVLIRLQDTVVALQALAEFSALTSGNNNRQQLSISLTAGGRSDDFVTLTATNTLILQSIEVRLIVRIDLKV